MTELSNLRFYYTHLKISFYGVYVTDKPLFCLVKTPVMIFHVILHLCSFVLIYYMKGSNNLLHSLVYTV
jgi:hypothetical protein